MTPEKIPTPEVIEDTAHVLKCLGHPVRLMILDMLDRKGELTVTQLHEALKLEQATTSQHLGLMKDKGILARRKEGVFVLYSIADERALKVLGCIRST
jgi:DNA-binding transcriptional ArsR family regulator